MLNRILCLLIALHIAGCVLNPTTGERQFILLPEETERDLGREQSERVRDSMGIVDDAGLNGYITAIGHRLSLQSKGSEQPFAFSVVDLAEPNAFALPGGYVYVSRGLLALANSEDEVACVIGHEMAHVLARHAAQRVSRAAPLGIVTGITSWATSIASPRLGGAIAGIGGFTNDLILAPYSRDQEHEADRIGIELAARAGWDPTAMARILQGLERESAARGNDPERISFLASHPSTPERVRAVRERGETLTRATVAPIAADRAAFLSHLDGMVVGAGAAQGVFDGELFRHPDFDLALQFPSGWKTHNGRAAVAAVAPDRDALIALQSSQYTTLDQAIDATAKKVGIDVEHDVQRLQIARLPAAHAVGRARAESGEIAVDLTWVAYGGRVFEIIGVTNPSTFATYRADLAKAAQSFRPLSAAERARIKETRLRIERARSAERLGDFIGRVGSVWNLQQTAIANGVESDATLETGQLVKVAKLEPYR